MSTPLFPQALSTSFAHRLAQSSNALFSNLATTRAAKRQASSKLNYAEDLNDDFDFEDNVANPSNLVDGTAHFNDVDIGNYTNNASNDAEFDFEVQYDDNSKTHIRNAKASHDYENDDNEDDEDYVDDDESKDATYEDPNAAYDIYRNLILNSTNSNNTKINLSSIQGNKEAPRELPPLCFSPEEVSTLQDSIIIPIKLKITTPGAVINDQILWNLNDELITPEIFASMMAQDLDLNRNTEQAIVSNIKDQIQNYKDLISNPNNSIIDQFLRNEKEFHAVLDISCNIGEDFFTDKVEWDLLDNTVTPEMFAKTIVADIGLKPEFETAIAVAVYDEIYKFKRELIENPQQVSQNIDSLPFFNLVNSDDASKGYVQGLRYDVRKYGEEFVPSVEKLSEWEIEKRETEKERNLRRRKRETLRVSGIVR